MEEHGFVLSVYAPPATSWCLSCGRGSSIRDRGACCPGNSTVSSFVPSLWEAVLRGTFHQLWILTGWTKIGFERECAVPWCKINKEIQNAGLVTDVRLMTQEGHLGPSHPQTSDDPSLSPPHSVTVKLFHLAQHIPSLQLYNSCIAFFKIIRAGWQTEVDRSSLLFLADSHQFSQLKWQLSLADFIRTDAHWANVSALSWWKNPSDLLLF